MLRSRVFLLALLGLVLCAFDKTDDPDKVWARLYDGGNLASDARRYGEAERLLKAAVERSRQYGPDDWRYRHSLHCLAVAYTYQGKYAEAEPIRKLFLSDAEDIKKSSDSGTLISSLTNLANVYRDWGKLDQADPLYARALAILENNPKVDPFSWSNSLTNQARLFRAQGRFAEAERNLKRALVYQIESSGGEKGYVSWVLSEYAALLQQMGRAEEADAKGIRAEEIDLRNHRQYAAEARERGRHEEAEMYEARAKAAEDWLAARKKPK